MTPARSKALQDRIREATQALGITIPIRNVISHRDGTITLITRNGAHKYNPKAKRTRKKSS